MTGREFGGKLGEMLKTSLLVLSAGVLVACGEDGKPVPGYADPCDTPMAGTIGCPASTGVTSSQPTIEDACHKLVSCGILAGEYLSRSGTECSTGADCKGGECLETNDGNRCHWHYLDYRWCTGHLANPGNDPCGANQPFTAQQVESTVACISITPCASLGLLFWQKRISDNRPDLDKFTCADGEKTTWTATICDHGLLDY